MKHVRLLRRLPELVVFVVVVLGSNGAVHDGDAFQALLGGLLLGVLVTCRVVDFALWQRRRRERLELEQRIRAGLQ